MGENSAFETTKSVTGVKIEAAKAEEAGVDSKPLVSLEDMGKTGSGKTTVIIDMSGSLDDSTKLKSAREKLNIDHVNVIEPVSGSTDLDKYLENLRRRSEIEQSKTKTDTGSTRIIDTEKEWQQKQAETNKKIIFTIDDAVIYPSKGCP